MHLLIFLPPNSPRSYFLLTSNCSQCTDTRCHVFQVPLRCFHSETCQLKLGISEFCVTRCISSWLSLGRYFKKIFIYFVTDKIIGFKKWHSTLWGSLDGFLVCQDMPYHAPKCPICKFLIYAAAAMENKIRLWGNAMLTALVCHNQGCRPFF